MANQIMVIKPYRWNGMWVFDDERVGLNKEPFVGGADNIIDAAVAQKAIPNADTGFLLLFSGDPFPGADVHLHWKRQETSGNVYQWNDLEGWLCPALLKYFATPPQNIHAQFKQI